MKPNTIKAMKKFIYSSILFSLFVSFSLNSFSQEKKLEETFSWKYDVNEDVRLSFNNYNCNLIIHTTDKAEIEYKMTVDIGLKSEEEVARLRAVIENLNFSHSATSAEFNNRFWDSKKQIVGKKTLEIKGEKNFSYTSFDMKGELWLPAQCRLSLKSKYSEIDMEDMKGEVKLELYNDKVYGGVMEGNLSIVAKYSKLEFKNTKDINADFYNTDLTADNIGNLNLTSKYSKLNTANTGNIIINGYNDKHSFGNTGTIKFIDKYSDLSAGNAESIELDCYTTDIVLGVVKNIELKTKYGSCEIEKAGNLNISSTYNTSFKFNSLDGINIKESKYGDFKIEELTGFLNLDEGYTDKFSILKSGKEFNGMNVNGKYIKINMVLDPGLQYLLKADVRYPHFNIDEKSMEIISKTDQSSELKMEAVKGTKKEGMPEFNVKGYDLTLTLTDD